MNSLTQQSLKDEVSIEKAVAMYTEDFHEAAARGHAATDK